MSSDSQLALRWIEARIRKNSSIHGDEELFKTVVDALDATQRMRLIQALPNDFWGREFLMRLVGDNQECFETLLKSDLDDYQRLAPVTHCASPIWEDLLNVAQESGYNTHEIANAIYLGVRSWVGRQSHYWAEQIKELDATMTKVKGDYGRSALAILRQRYDSQHRESLERDKYEDIYGRR